MKSRKKLLQITDYQRGTHFDLSEEMGYNSSYLLNMINKEKL